MPPSPNCTAVHFRSVNDDTRSVFAFSKSVNSQAIVVNLEVNDIIRASMALTKLDRYRDVIVIIQISHLSIVLILPWES